MAKLIVLYRLREGVSRENYENWCRSVKGPLFISFGPCRAYTILRIDGGEKGDGGEGQLPQRVESGPFEYIGLIEVEDMESWLKVTQEEEFREGFFKEWFGRWVGEFWVLGSEEVFNEQKG